MSIIPTFLGTLIILNMRSMRKAMSPTFRPLIAIRWTVPVLMNASFKSLPISCLRPKRMAFKKLALSPGRFPEMRLSIFPRVLYARIKTGLPLPFSRMEISRAFALNIENTRFRPRCLA